VESVATTTVSTNIQTRTKQFAIRIIHLAGALPRTAAGMVLGKQVLRSGTSIGANVEEAQDALSHRDFIHSIQIALKEARETLYWIDIIIAAGLLPSAQCEQLREECLTIIRILTAIVRKAKRS
jgi:four helix bundle protein